LGRPKVPLINRDEAIARTLELIDRDGVEAFSIRKLGTELGVNGASLYHHFKDKDEILDGARRLVIREARVQANHLDSMGWREIATRSVERYRRALLRHPNIAPLMAPGMIRPMAIIGRDFIIGKMLEAGVPIRLAYPIIDSVETLAFGSAVLNPSQMRPKDRFGEATIESAPNLTKAMRATASTAERMFRIELDALLDGWEMLVAQHEQAANRALPPEEGP
jgi:AcrR family transcriptional regulator